MLSDSCKVLELYKTSIGNIALLAFYADFVPHIGMIIHNKLNYRWEVTGIGMNRINEFEGHIDSTILSVWDCQLKSLDNVTIEKDEILYLPSVIRYPRYA